MERKGQTGFVPYYAGNTKKNDQRGPMDPKELAKKNPSRRLKKKPRRGPKMQERKACDRIQDDMYTLYTAMNESFRSGKQTYS